MDDLGEVFTAQFIIGAVVSTLVVTITAFLATKACKWAWPRVERKWSTWMQVSSISAAPAIGFVHFIWLQLPGHIITANDVMVIYLALGLAILSLLNLLSQMANSLRDATQLHSRHVGITEEIVERLPLTVERQ